MNPADLYARQRQLGWINQPQLESSRILIAGAGALGNEVIRNLALMGVGHFLVIDFDRVEGSNLSRCSLFRPDDIGSPKVEAVARSLASLRPSLNVRPLNGDLFHDVGLGWYRGSHLAIGCLDNLAARSQLSLATTLAGIPYLDTGMWSLGGEVRCFLPGDGSCFDCTLSPDDEIRAMERRSCSGFRDSGGEVVDGEASLASTASVIGGIAAQEAIKALSGRELVGGQAWVYNGEALRLHRTELPRRVDCPSRHQSYDAIIDVPKRASNITPRDLFELTRSAQNGLLTALSLDLGRDFLRDFHCTSCGRSEKIERLVVCVDEAERICPHCGTIRQAHMLRSVSENDAEADYRLSDLGVPDGEVLAIRTEEADLLLFGLTGGLWS